MARKLTSLPLIQNWDCHACGDCCTDYIVPVTEEERKRIEAQGWAADPLYAGKALFQRGTPWWQFWKKPSWHLAQGEGHRCIFLDEKKLCRIHAKFGFETKPLACRLYPFILVPAGDQWRVSMRYACPSATKNLGRPISLQQAEVAGLADEMATWGLAAGTVPGPNIPRPAPPLGPGQALSWTDLPALADALIVLLRQKGEAFHRRMLKALTFVRLCQRTRFEGMSGSRLRELFAILMRAVTSEAPAPETPLPPPGWVGRLLFRTTAAVYLRKDSGTRIGIARRGRLALIGAMFRMVWGRGRLPRLQAGLPNSSFADMEEPLGPLEPAVQEVLERYYEVKISSFQFCGPVCYDLTLWEGFAALALTLPVILWLARGYRNLGQAEAVYKAITVVDENFGYNPLLGQFRQRMSNRILFQHGELDRLVAWYGR